MTIYIDKSLTPQYSEKGWPEAPKFPLTQYTSGFWADYFKAIEKAKADSVPLDLMDKYTHDLYDEAVCKYPTSPPEFIEVEIGEVGVAYQRDFSSTCKERRFADVSKEAYDNYDGPFAQRKVVRVKPQPAEANDDVLSMGQNVVLKRDEIVEDWKARAIAHLSEGKPRCELELFVEKFFGISPPPNETFIIPNADYGMLVNLLAMFRDDQLAAANARIKELEDLSVDIEEIISVSISETVATVDSYDDHDKMRLGLKDLEYTLKERFVNNNVDEVSKYKNRIKELEDELADMVTAPVDILKDFIGSVLTPEEFDDFCNLLKKKHGTI